MEPTTTGRFRVLDRRPDGTILLVDLEAAAAAIAEPETASDADLRPLAVRPTVATDTDAADTDTDADGSTPTVSADSRSTDTAESEPTDLAGTVAALEPGYVIEASLQWDDSEARFAACSITNRTRIQYADGVTGVFEKAKETWHDAQVAGAAMNSAVTYSTGKDPNGVVYTFAKQRPPRDLFEEFRTGATPIEPLIQRVDAEHADAGDTEAERAVFVLNPADEEFVLLYIVFDRDGMLAKTVRDTYGLPAV